MTALHEPCADCRRKQQRWADDNDISREPGDERIIVTKLGALEMCRSLDCTCDCHEDQRAARRREARFALTAVGALEAIGLDDRFACAVLAACDGR